MHFFKEIVNLFFPEVCNNCNEQLVENESLICLKCRFDLPLSEITDIKDNLVERTFYGRVPIEFATSLFLYKPKGAVQKLIYQLKYKGNEDLGQLFGQWLGNELAQSDRLPKIDYVIPVPLHKKKLRTRGYNQVTKFGQEIANEIGAQFVDNILVSISASDTQSKKQRFDRWKNVKERFYLNDNQIFKNKSVLLVDDIITTGATLEACAIELQKSEQVKISIAAIAFTS